MVGGCCSGPGAIRIWGSEKMYCPNAGKSVSSRIPYVAPRAEAALADVNGVMVSAAKPFWLSIATPVTSGARVAVDGAAAGAIARTIGTSEGYVATLWTTSTNAPDAALAPVPAGSLRKAFNARFRGVGRASSRLRQTRVDLHHRLR